MSFEDWIIGLFRPQPPHPPKRPPVKPPKPVPVPVPVPTPTTNFATEILAAHNAIRATVSGLPPLKWSVILESDAGGHATLMATLRRMDHNLPGEANLGDRLTSRGYRWSWAAENIAFGYLDINSVVAGWRNSPGHYANIIGPSTEMGAARVVGGDGLPYWSVTFARPIAKGNFTYVPLSQVVSMITSRSEDETMSSLGMVSKTKDNPNG